MLTATLHPYQEPAVDMFLGRGSLLIAWAMGLGKTVAAIACAEELLGCGDIQTCMLVVPASLKHQWAKALAQFTDMTPRDLEVRKQTITVPLQRQCALIDGTPKKRAAQLKQALADKPDYIILSYETVLSDTRAVNRISPGLVVLDEASAIKSLNAKRTQKIKLILRSEYRIALTATPVENRPEEAFSIMQWVDPDILGPADFFERTYIDRGPDGTVSRYLNLPLFNRKMNLAMSRKNREDPDVQPYLPDADVDEWFISLHPSMREPYRRIAGDLLAELLKIRGTGEFDVHAFYAGQANEMTRLGRAMARQQALNMLLVHPDLVIYSGMDYEFMLEEKAKARELKKKLERLQRSTPEWERTKKEIDRILGKKTWPGSKYCYEIWQDGVLDDCVVSAKLDELVTRVRTILEFPDSKILIFTKYRHMLEIIEKALDVPVITYHGLMSPAEKAAAVSRFTTEPDLRVFLSTHAGAYGTDMFMADYLIKVDLPWSSGRDDQINGRHQRVSSEFPHVYVRNIITEGTTEERDLARLGYKRSLAAAVVDGRVHASDGSIENDLESLTGYLTRSL
jgi:SNF2 family DNA or RNA helicase